MTIAPSPYSDPDLRPAVVSKGLKTFHLSDIAGAAACGKTLKHPSPPSALNQRGALRRGLTLCANCAELEAAG